MKEAESSHSEVNNFEARKYREHMGIERFESFVITQKDSDLWIGIDKESFQPKIKKYAEKKLIKLRSELEKYLDVHTEFQKSFTSVKALHSAPIIAKAMSSASMKAQTGPMAAVAGAFSQFIGRAIQKKFDVQEIVVENGGDIYISTKKDLFISVFAGSSSLSEKVGINISGATEKLGICTSAGTVGPSFSFGKADAVMVVCEDTLVADAYATAIANEVRTADDIEAALRYVDSEPLIQTVLVICEEKIGIKGKHELQIVK